MRVPGLNPIVVRKGQRKIHRRYQPQLCCSVSRRMASKVVARISRHDWNRNGDLIALRQRGYIPYTYRHDPHFMPKPMRISTRSESREALTVLSQALAAHSDYNPDSDYHFEVMVPFEQIALAMGYCTFTRVVAKPLTWRCMRCR